MITVQYKIFSLSIGLFYLSNIAILTELLKSYNIAIKIIDTP